MLVHHFGKNKTCCLVRRILCVGWLRELESQWNDAVEGSTTREVHYPLHCHLILNTPLVRCGLIVFISVAEKPSTGATSTSGGGGHHLVLRQASDFDMINKGQYGSVPGKTAIELVMLNQISNDICRTNKYNIVIRFDNNTSACYNRILVHLGMMAARRCGMPENAIKVHVDTLEGMKYKVKTLFRTSSGQYTGDPNKPLFRRTGQGSRASPVVWLTLVVVLMNTLDQITGKRIQFRSQDTPDYHS